MTQGCEPSCSAPHWAPDASPNPASSHSVHRRLPLLLWLPYFHFLCVQRKAGCTHHSPGLNLAGAEGFEPPSSVLETDSLTVELTPLKAAVSDQFSEISFCLAHSHVINFYEVRAQTDLCSLISDLCFTSFPCAAGACGSGYRTS